MRSRRAEGYTNIFILMFAHCALGLSLHTRDGDGERQRSFTKSYISAQQFQNGATRYRLRKTHLVVSIMQLFRLPHRRRA